jgi:hypothetical protein
VSQTRIDKESKLRVVLRRSQRVCFTVRIRGLGQVVSQIYDGDNLRQRQADDGGQRQADAQETTSSPH